MIPHPWVMRAFELSSQRDPEVRYHGRRAYVTRASVERLDGSGRSHGTLGVTREAAPARLSPPEARTREKGLP